MNPEGETLLWKNYGILFDFNGVLFWDSHFHETAWKVYSKQIRGTELTSEEMVHHVHGRTNKDIFEYLLGKPVAGAALLQHIDGKEGSYRQICLDHPEEFKLAPGAIEYLDYLKSSNFRRTIATASEIGNLEFFFKHLELAKWFDFDLVAYDDGTIRGKPAPDIYLKAASNLNLNPADCVVIEDSRSGIAAAHNAHVGKIIALGTKEKHGELVTLEGVNQTIVDFYELLPKQANL